MGIEGCIWTVAEAPTLACSGLAADPWAVAAAGLGGGPGDGPDADPCGGPGPVLAGNTDRGGPGWGALTRMIPFISATDTLTAPELGFG